jgi:hypothetical protein
MSAINTLSESGERLRIDLTSQLDQQRADILGILDVQAPSAVQNVGDKMKSLSKMLLSLLEESKKAQHMQQILRSLVFNEIWHREEAIKDAHVKTLTWIFKKPETGFTDWLKAENGFYWVRGKVCYICLCSEKFD